jgi:nitrile hydratase
VERQTHDLGGRGTDAPIDRTEHSLADWELLADALVQSLVRNGVITVDQLRRAIETMSPAEYAAAGYYERWIYSVEHLLLEKEVVTKPEIERKLADAAE